MVVNGLTTYGFLVIARRVLGDDSYGSLAVLWGLVYIAGPGLFQPLEQEVARATAERASRGLGSAPVLRRAVVIGVLELMAVVVAVAVAWPLGLDELLDDRVGMLLALIVALSAFAGAELVRGVLSGRRLFYRYGWYFAAEGGGRLMMAGLLAAVGVRTVGPYALSLAFAFTLAAAVGLGWDRPFVHPGPSATYRELTPALGFLFIASLGEAFILNVGPVAVGVVATDRLGAEAPGVFLNGLIIARVPLFFFQAVKASLLPHLATRAGQDDLSGFRTMQLEIVGAVVVLSGLATAAAALVGPWIVESTFGDELSHRDMALMAGASGGLMIMLSLSLGLVALGHVRLAVIGWVAAVATFPAALTSTTEPFLRVEIALLAAVLVGSGVTAMLLRLEYAAHRRAVASAPGRLGGTDTSGIGER